MHCHLVGTSEFPNSGPWCQLIMVIDWVKATTVASLGGWITGISLESNTNFDESPHSTVTDSKLINQSG